MSFIQFESAREKEKARQDLRNAREEMLEDAKKRALKRIEHESRQMLKGETNWMLPSIEKKLKKKAAEVRKHKKKKNKGQSKRSKKTSHKKRRYSTSGDNESSDSDSATDSYSSNDSNKGYKKSPSYKKKYKKLYKRSSASEESADDKQDIGTSKKSEEPLKRDSWMTNTLLLKTYSREPVDNKNEKKQIEAYDPAKSAKELNPYWKTTGTGLPAFQKPNYDDDKSLRIEKSTFSQNSLPRKGWRKPNDKVPADCVLQQKNSFSKQRADRTPSCDEESQREETKKPDISPSEFLTDQQMNEVGAKLLKAEIMGNMQLAKQLSEKLEKARTQRNIFKDRQKIAFNKDKQHQPDKSNSGKFNVKNDEHILLTHTDQAGNSRPLATSTVEDPKELYGGKKSQKQKRVISHDTSGKRIRYFADDDRFDIKQMFEREKYINASEANLQFANIAAKHKNPNDDLEDIFTEKICTDDSEQSDRRSRNRAIREHQKMDLALDNCDKCFDSKKMQKERLVCVGENVYLALPWYQGLQTDHCMIISNQHVSCVTQIDENAWAEINEFRKALTRMFSAQSKDVIFFEIANKLYKRPHLVIHCIPISASDGEMAPFYFKKAIEESEHEWCVNKQLVSLRNKSLRNSIPKGLPYFWVNFGMETGFAHVIEDEERFPENFAQEIIGGMLNLDPNKWRKLQKEHNLVTKVKSFANYWKKYDCSV